MTRTIDDILAAIAARARGRTRYEGQEPREDDVLAAEVRRLRARLADHEEARAMVQGMFKPGAGYTMPDLPASRLAAAARKGQP